MVFLMPKAAASSIQHSDLLPAKDRRAAGQDMRRVVPRSAHAVWEPKPDRADPVGILIEQGRDRIARLLPIRYGRMQADAFAFLRGSAAVMAADLAGTPVTGLRVQCGGDAHLMNFGAGSTPTGAPLFDVNDFDETLPAPFEWDVKRLAASVAVAARVKGLSDKVCRDLARRVGRSYRRQMDELSRISPLDAWFNRIDLQDAVNAIGDRDVRHAQRARLQQAVEASANSYAHILASDGTLRLPERPPAIYRMDGHEDTAHEAFLTWRDSLPEERRALVDRYRLRDLAFKAVGVGSVGTFCAIGLFATADGDKLLLQIKQAQTSVLAPFAGASAYAHHGERVVVGQRLMQAIPDVFLGWATGGPKQLNFYVRQLKDSRLASIGSALEADALPFYAKLCGPTLARAHARSGDAAAISGYLGEGDGFDGPLASFAMAYADQTERDYEEFLAAIRAGRIEAKQEAKK
jgi:uncharacterized protein (DUF2252 family)